ncbi:late secretory pathway protein avl9-related [Holotrichia oblita]|uniref:Late secretory pathway protein avl9-related n=1 Tax=Holotrichia oblita TaxID=644536 RepID=A0ACB9T3Y9_HOLOL|nr:late secretory pathway protein avl9-related [Holotrichia oblita]
MNELQKPILYVIVVGFHHKKGCQVEYSFPPLIPDSPNECPPGWKYLPTLALPDGSHNYDEDTVFFHLPSLTQPKKTVYGISCYRQIPVEKLKNRTADITRGTVQKSVCVLSTIPLFGHIQVKMSLITHAYFDEGDFSKVSLLEDTYHHLNSVLIHNDLSSQTYVGLFLRDFVLHWKHKAILLFKLLLLEKRVIFHKSPVHPLCSTILSLLSLYPGMIEQGLEQAACVRLSRPMSPMPNYSDDDITPECSPKHISSITNEKRENVNNVVVPNNLSINRNVEVNDTSSTLMANGNENKEDKCNNVLLEKSENRLSVGEIKNIGQSTEIGIDITESSSCELNDRDGSEEVCGEPVPDTVHEHNVSSSFLYLAQLKNNICGFPLQLFYQGYLCLPYLSLPYMDLLSDVNVRGYVVGATNVLFKQKRQLFDILVDIDVGRIECQDPELRKQLHLTTEDLRFADYIVKHVAEEKHDVFLDGVGWEGGDEWIRMQFKIYLLCLLRTSILQDGSREFDHFNSSFMSAWKDTYNYKMWNSLESPGILEVNPGHPFSGQLSVSDMKLRLSHTIQNTESGRKLNQAMVTTGRAVATTSKAVGGAFSQAKGVFSNWWSNLLVSPDPVHKGVDTLNENRIEENTDMKKANASENDDTISNNQDKNKNIPNGFIVTDVTEKETNTGASQNRCVGHNPGEVHLV